MENEPSTCDFPIESHLQVIFQLAMFDCQRVSQIAGFLPTQVLPPSWWPNHVASSVATCSPAQKHSRSSWWRKPRWASCSESCPWYQKCSEPSDPNHRCQTLGQRARKVQIEFLWVTTEQQGWTSSTCACARIQRMLLGLQFRVHRSRKTCRSLKLYLKLYLK